jgi:hypothetical protein
MVTRKADRAVTARKRAPQRPVKQRSSGHVKSAATRTSKVSTEIIKEAVRQYEPALRRLADR